MRMLGWRNRTGAFASTAERASSVSADSSRSKYIVAARAVRSRAVTGALVGGPAFAAAAAAAAAAARAASALAIESSFACSRRRLSAFIRLGAGACAAFLWQAESVAAESTTMVTMRESLIIVLVDN